MNQTPSSERLHIAIFGRRNAGKSSLINALTRQEAAIVSAVPGTTTDPVRKSMEILPIGPVVIVDTAGIDDVGELGEKRIRMTMRILDQTNLALLVLDQEQSIDGYEEELLEHFRKRETDVIAVANKIDSNPDYSRAKEWAKSRGVPFAAVSAMTGEGIEDLKRLMADVAPENFFQPAIIGDLLNPGDIAILVIPVDKAAPKGRLILPQVMTLRDAIDHDAYAMVVKERELRDAIGSLNKKPKIVVTDSQAVLKASADTPRDIPFTTFSILFARYKGDLEMLAKGAKALRKIKPGAKVLIAEGCTHHPVPDDIGQVQIPRWLRQYAGGEIQFDYVSGGDFPANLAEYDLVVHCGACMLNRQEMLARLGRAEELGIPIINYGVFLCFVHGVLERALEPFPLARLAFEED
ncbi:MAG: [FeFe] hydrogenase H-cluster maturation GTPase HydF [Armatimonadetes bacterium]|nr:[FeFe] hydrogenase H-cluster maturation GTPase HydF [Armatimonadota bacterium]